MKRGRQFGDGARAAGDTRPKGIDPRLDGEIDDDHAAGCDGAELLREAVRETEPLGAFDARAIRELYKAAPADPKGLRRTIRRSQLRQIVPLADSTIYELERREELSQRLFLTARCVVWDLGEVLAWIQSRRRARSNGAKKTPMPDVRQRVCQPISAKGQPGDFCSDSFDVPAYGANECDRPNQLQGGRNLKGSNARYSRPWSEVAGRQGSAMSCRR